MWQSNTWQIISLVLYIMNMVLAVYISTTLILRKQDPVKTLSWVAVIMLLPYFGIICYIAFGQNYRKHRLYGKKGYADFKLRKESGRKQIEALTNNPNLLPQELVPFKRLIYQNLKNSHTVVDVNDSIDFFFTGRDALDAMFNEIAHAKHHIHLQSYIIEDDETGRKFRELLINKAKEGVEVKLIYDGVGSLKLKNSFIEPMKEAGIETLVFSPVTFVLPLSKINYRNHRKILVIDGKTGFLGGVNIANRYYTNTSEGGWHDTHIRIKGESVFTLQACFLMDRHFIKSRNIRRRFRFKKRYYPPLDIKERREGIEESHIYSQIISSGPDSSWASIMQCFFSAITTAQKHIYIVTPYFTPCESILNAIKIAALGGVDVKIMLPEQSDTKLTHWSTRSYISELLDAGVKIGLFKKGFNHSKVVSIDGLASIVGSANMDVRSFEHNFEIMGVIYNKDCAEIIENQFIKDFKSCTQIELHKWIHRSKKDKIRESFARLCTPLL